MKNADIVIVGSGSLAAKLVLGLAQARKAGLRVAIVGRSRGKVSKLTQIANTKAAILSDSTRFVGVEVEKFRRRAFRDCSGR